MCPFKRFVNFFFDMIKINYILFLDMSKVFKSKNCR